MTIDDDDKSSILLGKLIIGMFIILTLGAIIAIIYFKINIGMELYRFVYRFYEEFGVIGINIGVFIISIFGNFTIILPVPYLFALVLISLIPDIQGDIFMLLLLGFSAGLGASIGELSAWILGRAGKTTLEESSQLKKMNRWVDKGYAPYLIFLFAATPLPDDAFIVVLGLANYALWKVLIFCFLGKVVLTCSAAFFATVASETTIGQLFFQLYGINLTEVRTGVIQQTNFGEIVTSTIVWILSITIIIGLILIDWDEVVGKIRKRLKGKKLRIIDE